jgi:hypothetical protein
MESFGGYTENLRQFNVSNLRVSTSFRNNFFDKDTNCIIDFTQNRVINNIVKINLNSVTICNNFFNIASYNNKYSFIVITNGTPVVYEDVVPPGYYNTTTLADYIQSSITNGTGATLTTVVWNEDLRRFVINTNDATIKIRFNVSGPPKNYLGNNFLYIIGQDPLGLGYEADNTDTPFPYPPNLAGATNIYILSNKLCSGKSILNVLGPNDSNTSRDLQSQSGNEIMSLGITSAFGAYETYYDSGSDRAEFVFSQGIALDSLDLKFVDEFGNVLETDAINTPIYLSFKIIGTDLPFPIIITFVFGDVAISFLAFIISYCSCLSLKPILIIF